MNLSQLTTAVYTETARPDLVSETLQAILESTLSVHTCEDFYKDITEAVVVFDQPTQYLQTLDTGDLPYYRNMAYIRKTNPIATQVEQTNGLLPNQYIYPPNQFNFLTRIDIGDALDMYGYEKQDVWYQAGNQVNIKSSTALQYTTVGYYKYPNLDATGVEYNSWIATEMPYAIIYRASGIIFAKIGEDKSWAMYMKQPIPGQGDETGGMYYQQLAQLKKNNITAGR
jgi:hypothetical protein